MNYFILTVDRHGRHDVTPVTLLC